jgi:hypothetical protein
MAAVFAGTDQDNAVLVVVVCQVFLDLARSANARCSSKTSRVARIESKGIGLGSVIDQPPDDVGLRTDRRGRRGKRRYGSDNRTQSPADFGRCVASE